MKKVTSLTAKEALNQLRTAFKEDAVKEITVDTIKADISAIKSAEKLTLTYYKRVTLELISGEISSEEIKTLREWIKQEYKGSWANKFLAFVSGCVKYADNIRPEEVLKVSRLTALQKLVRMAKDTVPTATDAEAAESRERTGGKAGGSGNGKRLDVPAGDGKGDGNGTLSDAVAETIKTVEGLAKNNKKKLRDLIYDITGEIAQLSEKEQNPATLKTVTAYLMLAQKVLKA